MKKWEYGEECIRIKVIVIVPDHVQKREKDVKCVKDVQGHQKKIETNLVLESRHTSFVEIRIAANLSKKNKYWEYVTNDAHSSNDEHKHA